MNDFVIQWDRSSFGIPVWVCVDEGYLYMHETLEGVLAIIQFEYKHDRHLVG